MELSTVFHVVTVLALIFMLGLAVYELVECKRELRVQKSYSEYLEASRNGLLSDMEKLSNQLKMARSEQ